jgi:hypothetical protein
MGWSRLNSKLILRDMTKLKSILSAIAAAAATVAGLDVNGFIAVLPPEAAKWLVIIPSGAAVVVHIVEAILNPKPVKS